MPHATHHVWFAHGKEGTPNGAKIERLTAIARALGFHTESVDYRGIVSPDDRVKKLLSLNPDPPGKLVLVGSSMGGYLSLAASATLNPEGIFLLAPAIGLPGYALADPAPRARLVTAIHGWRDDVVPPQNVIEFADRHRVTLHLVEDGHRLLDAMPVIERLFPLFLSFMQQRQFKVVPFSNLPFPEHLIETS